MFEWKAAMILPSIYLMEELTMWNRVSGMAEKVSPHLNAFSSARDVIKMYALDTARINSKRKHDD